MQKQCATCQATFLISDRENRFIAEMTFRFGNEEFSPPLPEHCPDCRLMLRVCHRNERNLYKTQSTLSQKPIVSIYASKPIWGEPYSVYSPEEWHADTFSPMLFGATYDFSEGFFKQFALLQKTVPRISIVVVANENCDFVTGTAYSRNCYLINSSENCEDCYYGKLLQQCKDSMDCTYLFDSQLCYECYSVYNSYKCTFLFQSQNCYECWFSANLNGCKNCFLCTNLHQKEYYYENKSLSKDEYEKKIADVRGSHSQMEKAREQLLKKVESSPRRYANIINSEGCTGDYIENSKDCFECYDITKSQDCMYVQTGVEVKDNIDCSNMYLKVEHCYQILGAIECFHCAFCMYIFNSSDLLYCDYCTQCHDCFGCVGLTHKSYCIFNTQYSKEEYNEIVPRILNQMENNDEWGAFHPAQYSPYGYNESLAQEYKPLTKEEAHVKGFYWRDDVDQRPTAQKIIPANKLPDHIREIPDDILNWAITCEVSGRPFQIIKRELQYYRDHELPIPHLHPDERHNQRMTLRNTRTLFNRTCTKCSKEIQTTYAPDRPEAVYCEECYLKEVY